MDGQLIVVAIHTKPLQVHPMEMLMSEVKISGIALSCNTFPSVIEEMAAGTYPLDGWVDTIPFDRIMQRRLRAPASTGRHEDSRGYW